MVDLFAFGDSAGDYFITKRTTPECEDDRGFEELFAALNVNRLRNAKPSTTTTVSYSRDVKVRSWMIKIHLPRRRKEKN
jgi:hypothetical protein